MQGMVEDKYSEEEKICLLDKKRYISSHNVSSDIIGVYNSFLTRQSMIENIRLDTPFYVTWNITNRCNLKCKYCSNESEFASENELSKREKLMIVDKLARSGIKHLYLLGGEPTLIEGFNEIIDRILSNGMYLSFSTNGIGIDEETIKILMQYSTNMYDVNVSCDSIVEKNNAMNRGRDSYKNAIKALTLFNKISGINLTFFSVLTVYTQNDIKSTYNYLKTMRIRKYGITVALKKGRATDEDIIDVDDIVEDLYEVMKDSEKTKITEVFASLGYSSPVGNKDIICDYNFTEEEKDVFFREKCCCCITRLHIESNGDVYPCDNLKYPPFCLGYLLSESLQRIWNSDMAITIASIRRAHKKECSTCAISNCTTGCMGLAFEAYRSLYRKDPNCMMFTEGQKD